MSRYLLLPMTVCLFISLWGFGILAVRRWNLPRVFYPKSVYALKSKLLEDKTGRYIYGRYSIWCSLTESKLSPESYLLCSLISSVFGFFIGLITHNAVISISLFVLLLFTPTLVLYAHYTLKLNRMIQSFAQFVDLFSRLYSSRKNIVLAFREMVEECPKELLSELILLNNRLTDGGDSVKAIEAFAERLSHDWATDFATYIASGLEGETADIQASLQRLTNEMFIQQDEKEERQSEIYSIWISLIIVIAICILLIPYNQTLLKDSYRLYFFTPDGQALLAISVTIWCFSILLALIWGRRQG
ncbi:type II secretion system F family protein [Brevibacillus sp. SYSU BS000544]|uniref:type II secretion system F family protein n=1 Tax=Brevibacillus sp. SYSU BS000544 TaxID=3416443 RepID=UPI003CE5C68E